MDKINNSLSFPNISSFKKGKSIPIPNLISLQNINKIDNKFEEKVEKKAQLIPEGKKLIIINKNKKLLKK